MADLVTLSGHYDLPLRMNRRQRHSNRVVETVEMMDGFGDWLMDTGKAIVAPVVSTVKGTGHFFMEAGRGFKTGDWKRVVTSPFKGAGHIVGDFYRTEKKAGEYFWRPSKMRVWMKPVGGVISTASLFLPPPFNVIGLGVGAVLTLGGTIGEGIYQKNEAKKAKAKGDELAIIMAEERSRKNWVYLGGATILLGGLWYAVS